MSRRSVKSGTNDRLVSMPLWLAVALPVLTWLAFSKGIPLMAGSSPLSKMWSAQAPAWTMIVGAVCLAGWAAGLRRRQLMRSVQSLETLRALSWKEFELLVGQAYRALGYSVSENWKGGADGGVDLDLRRSDERLLAQCKQWRTRRVPVEKARELWGIVASENASGAVLVTCGSFTTDAESFAQGKTLQLVDGEKLASVLGLSDVSALQGYSRSSGAVARQWQSTVMAGRETRIQGLFIRLSFGLVILM